MRKYENDLLEHLEKGKYISYENGIPYEIRPIPEKEKTVGMDPRMLKAAKEKSKKLQKTFSPETFQLYEERFRPDKINYDLTTEPILKKQLLISSDDHYINTFFYWPEQKEENLPVVIYVHGGAFMTGDHTQFENQCRFIAQHAQALVVFPEYRLAPENPFPAGLKDVENILSWIADKINFVGVDKTKIIMAGDSAGASILNGCALGRAKDHIRLLFEIYPCCDIDIIGNGIYRWDKDYYKIPKEEEYYISSRMERLKNASTGMNLFYTGNKQGTNPQVSIVYQEDFSAFPETVVAIGEYDFLRISADLFAKKLKKAGKLKKAIRYQGCDHGFFDMFGIMPQAEDIAWQLIKEIKRL